MVDLEKFVVNAESAEGKQLLDPSNDLIIKGPYEKSEAFKMYEIWVKGTTPLYLVKKSSNYYLCH